jgi:uncharacterized protein YdeI (YjbR/CyaY-like superfamily)
LNATQDDDVHAFRDAAEWEAWLAANHDRSTGAWLRIGRKGTDAGLISIGCAADVAFCHGWIDSQRKAFDASSFLQRYSPRRAGSPWSKRNVERVEALMAEGRMHSAGLAEVEAAKADGRWALAYEPQREAQIPADLSAALEANDAVRARFAALGRTERYALMLPLLKSRTEADRAARLERLIEGLERPRDSN